jgi:hypothetical protein
MLLGAAADFLWREGEDFLVAEGVSCWTVNFDEFFRSLFLFLEF